MLSVMKKWMVVGVAVLALAACGSNEVKEEAEIAEKEGVEQCSEPRPQMCTMEYRPVCGITKDGADKTYGNGCGACGDAEVISFTEGECAE